MLETLRSFFAGICLPFVRSGSESSQKLQAEIDGSRIRRMLDQLHFCHRCDREENCFMGILERDDDFRRDVLVVIYRDIEKFHGFSIVEDWTLENTQISDALLFCNKWNSRKNFPRAYVDPFKNILVADWVLPLDRHSSNDFIRDRVIGVMLSSSWHFFVEAGQALKIGPKKTKELES